MKDNEIIESIVAEKSSKIKISFPWFEGNDFFLEVMSIHDRNRLYRDLMNGKSIIVPSGSLKPRIGSFLEIVDNDDITKEEIEKKIREIDVALKTNETMVNKDNLEGFIIQQIEFLTNSHDQGKILLKYDNGKYDLSEELKKIIEETLKRFNNG